MNSIKLSLLIIKIVLSVAIGVGAAPECAEFNTDIYSAMNNSSRILKTQTFIEEIHFKHQLNDLFESYKIGNWKKVEYALKTLKQIKLSMQSEDKLKPRSSHKILAKEFDDVDYPVTKYTVTTADGYVLTIHRISHSPKSIGNNTKVPVYLMHGLLESANGWMALGAEHSLAYLLADAGYDVWMGNARGTTPSREHITYDANGNQRQNYWAFSWHEIGIHDLPASIDYILMKTNQTRLHYIGLSQGTTAFFVMASERPEYNEKIITMNAMAPIAFLSHSSNRMLNLFDSYYSWIKRTLDFLGIYSFDVGNKALKWITEYACLKVESDSPFLCTSILYFMESNQINCTSLNRILEHTPNTASLRQIYHYAQIKRSGKFQRFDFGDSYSNRAVYTVTDPPAYNLSKISSVVNMFYSSRDESANFEDVMYLRQQLPNVGEIYKIPNDDFKHIDFIYSRFVRKLINEKIIDVLQSADGRL